ncbi:glycosyltransferase family 39 protein [Planktothrix pseudagardhii]|uniref:Dolichyl-phosphate-mannose-protein mannosyltransferase n=1 Tax=Planktothrix pseudagardhii TaxID=132604 RepID=A0A9W4CPH6_9CYAN|nr:glycosyltransferase family 39 protein [Planktothrix pseudagardhii]CAD5944444.1 Dolichyl-phosphate-mannose-protein mannosyltransferase [Planktothrix pseudagardhii]
MNQSPALGQQHPPTWLKSIVICLLALGIFFRFAHLGHKMYWHDESFTSLAISGHTLAELKQEVFNHHSIIPITTLDKFQQINPERGVADTVRYLITSDPQHPPLYYVMARLWAQLFGDSPAQVRSLSAVISLLIFPCVYWLCLELFDAPSVGWVALGLIAVSPLEIFFAQEARQYGLWMVTILLSSAALLRAIRRESLWSWALYALTLALGLYTHLFTVLVAIAQGIYVVISQQFRWHKTLRNYLIATAMGLLMFLPWLIVFITHIHTALQLTSWSSFKIINNPLTLIAIWLTRTTRIFFDINLASDAAWVYSLASESPLIYSISTIVGYLLLITYLIYFFINHKYSFKMNLFVFLLGGISGLSLLWVDIIFGGIRSIHFRYQLPLYLSLQIVITYILTFHLLSDKMWQQKLWNFILFGLIISGLVSDFNMFKANTWWTQINGDSTIKISQMLNQYESPLLLINDDISNLGAVLTLSSRLQPKVSLLPVRDNPIPEFPHEYKNIFFFDFNNNLLPVIQQNKTYLINLIDPIVEFWHIEKIQK